MRPTQSNGTVPEEWFDDLRHERDELAAQVHELTLDLEQARRQRDAARSLSRDSHARKARADADRLAEWIEQNVAGAAVTGVEGKRFVVT